MSVLFTDDVALWDYAYDTTGGSPTPIASSSELKPDPTREYIADGDNYIGNLVEPLALPNTIDDLTRRHGSDRSYRAMRTNPTIFSSTETLKLGIMAGTISLVETHPMKPGQKKTSGVQAKSREIKEFSQRLIDRGEGIRSALMQMYDCPWKGNKLGEMTGRIEEMGKDAGKMVLDSFHVKKGDAWQFVVNRHLTVTGILMRSESGSFKRIRPDKFVWFSWMPEDNDPRGRSVLRSAYTAWNMTVQLYPQYLKALKQFAVPSLHGTTSPDAQPVQIAGKTYTAEEYMLMQMVKFQNGSAMATAYGSDVKAIVVPGNGISFLDAFNFLKDEMIYSILLQTRATKEARFGSKADSAQGADILNLLVEYGRDMGSEAIRNRLLKFFVALNFGKEVADEFTPYVYMGQGEPQDLVAKWQAAAALYRAKAITPSMVPEFNAQINIPVPDPEVDRLAVEATQEPPAEPTEEEPEDTEEAKEEEELVAVA